MINANFLYDAVLWRQEGAPVVPRMERWVERWRRREVKYQK